MTDHERYKTDLSNYDWLMKEIILREAPQAIALALLLHRHLRPNCVLDVGCGPGIYLLGFKAKGSEVLGIDGAPGSGEALARHDHRIVDLRQPWEWVENVGGETYAGSADLTLCIEVAEHIEPEYAPTLVQTIKRASTRYIFFSAAYMTPEGTWQGGEGHWNLQPRSYWQELFVPEFRLSDRNDEIMFEINADPCYDYCHWLRWNGMLLERQHE